MPLPQPPPLVVVVLRQLLSSLGLRPAAENGSSFLGAGGSGRVFAVDYLNPPPAESTQPQRMALKVVAACHEEWRRDLIAEFRELREAAKLDAPVVPAVDDSLRLFGKDGGGFLPPPSAAAAARPAAAAARPAAAAARPAAAAARPAVAAARPAAVATRPAAVATRPPAATASRSARVAAACPATAAVHICNQILDIAPALVEERVADGARVHHRLEHAHEQLVPVIALKPGRAGSHSSPACRQSSSTVSDCCSAAKGGFQRGWKRLSARRSSGVFIYCCVMTVTSMAARHALKLRKLAGADRERRQTRLGLQVQAPLQLHARLLRPFRAVVQRGTNGPNLCVIRKVPGSSPAPGRSKKTPPPGP